MVSLNDRSYPYVWGMTLLELLKADNVDIHGAVLITLNGRLVKRDCYNETLLSDGDEVLSIVVSGGG